MVSLLIFYFLSLLFLSFFSFLWGLDLPLFSSLELLDEESEESEDELELSEDLDLDEELLLLYCFLAFDLAADFCFAAPFFVWKMT
jgi:hypothetical protein